MCKNKYYLLNKYLGKLSKIVLNVVISMYRFLDPKLGRCMKLNDKKNIIDRRKFGIERSKFSKLCISLNVPFEILSLLFS